MYSANVQPLGPARLRPQAVRAGHAVHAQMDAAPGGDAAALVHALQVNGHTWLEQRLEPGHVLSSGGDRSVHSEAQGAL